MSIDPEKIQSVHCFLDIVLAFVKEVPIQDKEWEQYRADAIQAMEIAQTILLPLPQREPCKGKIIRLVVERSTASKKS